MDKIKFSELITKYTLEPTLLDIYVEGKDDVMFYGYHMSSLGMPRNFIDISSIKFDSNWWNSGLGLENNNRDKIIYLIRELSSRGIKNRVYGVIDRDILMYTRGLPTDSHILLTDFSCIEMYYLIESNISKIQHVAFPKFTEGYIESILSIASGFSCLLIAEKRLGLSIEKIIDKNFHKYYDKENNIVRWDKYLEACMNHTEKYNVNRTELFNHLSKMQEQIKKIQFDINSTPPRMYVCGHFFFLLLSVIAKKNGIDECPEELERLYRVSIDTDFIKGFPLFCSLSSL